MLNSDKETSLVAIHVEELGWMRYKSTEERRCSAGPANLSIGTFSFR